MLFRRLYAMDIKITIQMEFMDKKAPSRRRERVMKMMFL